MFATIVSNKKIEQAILSSRRFSISIRLFSTVLLTTVIITTMSLGVFQWTMKENFAKYVADVEMQKLDHLIENLSGVYGVYHDWGDAIQAQILQIDGEPTSSDFDHFSRIWLRRQYDIAQQQSQFKQNTMLGMAENMEKQNLIFNFPDHNFDGLSEPIASQYQPFEGFKFPSANHKNFDGPPNGLRFLPPFPDKLGLNSRLSLYDSSKRFIVGEPNAGALAFREIKIKDQVVGYLGLRPVLDQDDALSLNFFSTQKRILILIYTVTVLASLILALLLANYFKKPIHRLLDAAQALTQGNYQHHVEIKRDDELGDLSIKMNQVSEILYQHEQSRRQWVADTSHELKTPLAVLQAQIEAMQDGIRKPTPEHLNSMMSQVSSLKKLTQDLADLAQVDVQQLKCYFSQIDPWQIVLQEVENFKPKLEQSQLNIITEGRGTTLSLDQDRFRQIIVNLLSNSVRYTEHNGTIQIHTLITLEHWTVYVDDSPLGLTDEQLARLGERFYRVDDSRARTTGGTGLGLALSVKLARALGGELTFHHSPLGGLRCKLSFKK